MNNIAGAPYFLLIANTGGCGNNWVSNVFRKMPQVAIASCEVPGLSHEIYHRKIANDPELLRHCDQNISFRRRAPLDCLMQEIREVYPGKSLYVLSHFFNAKELLDSFHRYPPQIPHWVMYSYGCPVKRFRAIFKASERSMTLGSFEVDQWANSKRQNSGFNALIEKTQARFNRTLTNAQIVTIANNIYDSLHVIEDLNIAVNSKFRLINFEWLKKDPDLLCSIFYETTAGDLTPPADILADIYANSDKVGTNGIWVGSQHHLIDDNMDALLKAPYDSAIMWQNMNDWQQFLFRETLSAFSHDYIDFYDNLGIDLSFTKET